MQSSPFLERTTHLTPKQVHAVTSLATEASDADGVFPLSEHVMLHLRRGGDAPAVHLLIRAGRRLAGRLIAYAHVDTTDPIEGASAELVVHPMHRRRGLGRALYIAATAAAAEHDPAVRLRLWAHGDHPSAAALAISLGLMRHRVLLQMRRSLYAQVPAPAMPDGVELRTFVPGVDDDVFIEVNARAFADLTDQGRWTRADLTVRMAEPWFDPDGFIMAWRGDDLLGFDWTKVHGADAPGHGADAPGHGADAPGHELSHRHQGVRHGHDPIGEIYVLGIDPSGRGLRLGDALTLAGLRYMRARGLEQAMLYVDESNQRAIELYQRNGFARWTTDVSYQRSTV